MCKQDGSKAHLNLSYIASTINPDDCLGLLYDSEAQAGDLSNPIHPVFRDSFFSQFLYQHPEIGQALRLASLFLEYDSLLEFFIPFVFGKEYPDPMRGGMIWDNPVASKSRAQIKSYIGEVRNALVCLAHCIVFRPANLRSDMNRLWARTFLDTNNSPLRPKHTSACSDVFKSTRSVIIEIDSNLLDFYKEGYSEAHACSQFRHDFQIAQTLVHEVVHAFGAMRRGNLNEPRISPEHPDTGEDRQAELGYAWENFMFGGILNPQGEGKCGTDIFFRKTWASSRQQQEAGGREYAAIPVRYIADWFQKETWAKIKRGGPLAIPMPTIHIKFNLLDREKRWAIYSDIYRTRNLIIKLVKEHGRDIKWYFCTSETLQKSKIPIPLRVPAKIMFSKAAEEKKLSIAAGSCRSLSISSASSTGTIVATAATTVTTTTSKQPKTKSRSTSSASSSRKRMRDDDDVVEIERAEKNARRTRSHSSSMATHNFV
jgi:hypothetical protein